MSSQWKRKKTSTKQTTEKNQLYEKTFKRLKDPSLGLMNITVILWNVMCSISYISWMAACVAP